MYYIMLTILYNCSSGLNSHTLVFFCPPGTCLMLSFVGTAISCLTEALDSVWFIILFLWILFIVQEVFDKQKILEQALPR